MVGEKSGLSFLCGNALGGISEGGFFEDEPSEDQRVRVCIMCMTCWHLRWKANRVPGATHRASPSQSKPSDTAYLPAIASVRPCYLSTQLVTCSYHV
ncbi:hypothetical protein HBI25_105410 [Parastagonospora nodorum]|nr:hypothetical protein HBI10_016650 [Parastagonospora nodorum]KAH4025843.1 hypothetical protein HBI13_070580 [Parastagonospora nodorum]KAH4034929.1 hypothetical protein HBI09_105030 [Parastagonospora nodorum]KAH4186792.1 hypothetical protein HBI95_236770 [Parastagonospora nodorum]KAH4412767.1 hypothetical protein HBH92_099850 [Parastagonospora nodorum]